MKRQLIEEKATALWREPVHSRFIAGGPRMSTFQDHNVIWKNVPTCTITAGGVEFAYRELGQDNPGTPVVFLVHLAAVMDNWDPRVVDGFAAKHRVVVFDNRGVGASSGSPANSMEQMAKDAITFIKAMGFEQVDLFGFSMGGMIAQEIVQMESQLVRKMIITGRGPAGGAGISKVARVTYLDMVRVGCPAKTPNSSCSSPERPTESAPAENSWRDCRSVPRTGTRKSPYGRCKRS